MAVSNSNGSFIESFVCDRMNEWNIPGLAISVVHEDDVILQIGQGKREYESTRVVDIQTLFPIGSLTKAFTTTAIAMLVEEGILDWDRPIRHYVPQFKMLDPTASDQVTLRDIACHRSGLPRHDLAWYAPTDSRADLVHRIRYLQSSQPFRSTFQYNNLMYTVAGYVVESVLGISWEDFVRKRIAQPLGMLNTSCNLPRVSGANNYAAPHIVNNSIVNYTRFLDVSAIGPAGSIVSNIEDMTKWLRFHITGGECGDVIISRKALVETHSPHMAFSIPPDVSREIPIQTYGLGWGVYAYRGYALVSHDGGVDGFSAYISMIPKEKYGVVILANLEDCQSVLAVIGRTILDRLLGLEPVDWNVRTKARLAKSKLAQVDPNKLSETQTMGYVRPYNEYIGQYHDDGYGTMELALENDQLYIRYYPFSYKLRWINEDTFEVVKDEAQGGDSETIGDLVRFGQDQADSIDSIAIKMEPASEVLNVIFKRIR